MLFRRRRALEREMILCDVCVFINIAQKHSRVMVCGSFNEEI